VALEPLEMLEIFRETYTGTDASAVKLRRRITYARFQASPAVWLKSALFEMLISVG
jgi:hypothetical protein